MGIDRRLDLQAHRGAEAASGQLPLESLQQVFGVILLDLDVLIARDAEGVVLEDVHAREEVVQVGRDDILERHKALRADSDESRQGRGHLDAGKELGPGHGIAHHDGEIQRQPTDVGEGMTGIDREWREHGEGTLVEEDVQLGALIHGQ